jgi:hypothetical protein
MAYTIDDELRSQSAYSPGVVKDEEELLRIIFYPEHIVDNIVQPSAIALDDLRSRGFSVDRRPYAQHDILRRNVDNLRNRQQGARQVDYVARLQCREVRDIQDNNVERAFIVIDTAYETNIAHASIYSARPRTDAHLRRLRNRLLVLLETRCNLEDLFP